MNHDIEYLQSRMGKLEGSAGVSQHLISVVQNKLVAKEAEKTPSSVEPKITPGAQVEKHSPPEHMES